MFIFTNPECHCTGVYVLDHAFFLVVIVDLWPKSNSVVMMTVLFDWDYTS